jgi:hypothetical protein
LTLIVSLLVIEDKINIVTVKNTVTMLIESYFYQLIFLTNTQDLSECRKPQHSHCYDSITDFETENNKQLTKFNREFNNCLLTVIENLNK